VASAVATSPGAGVGDPGLKREVGFIGLMWASEGSIIGSGWLFGALFATQLAGPAAILAWVVGAVACMLLALVHAELGGLFPVAGGTARFPHYAYGSLVGYTVGWMSWLQAAAVAPIEVEAAIQYGSSYLHWLTKVELAGTTSVTVLSVPGGYIVAVVLMALFCGINLWGIRRLAQINNYATWWKVAVPVLAIVVLFIARFHGANFGSAVAANPAGASGFMPFGPKGVLEAVAAGGVVFALLGFEQAVQLGAESANPQRDIPRAVIGAMIIGTIIYLLLQVVFIGALQPHDLAKGWGLLSFGAIAGPYAGLATGVGLGWLTVILYIDALISPAGTGLLYVTATSRLSYGLSRNGYIPTIFEKLGATSGVPWFSILFAFIAGLFFFLPFPGWQQLVGFITSASVLMYAGAPLAFGALRLQLPDHHRPFRLPGGSIISPLSFIVANFIIYWSGWNVDWKLFLAIIIGFLVLAGEMMFGNNPNKPKLDWRSAVWLWPYLIGMAIISYLGQFGQLAVVPKFIFGIPQIPFWWDLVVVAIFSLVIYYWAVSLRLPVEKVKEYIAGVTYDPQTAGSGPPPTHPHVQEPGFSS